MPLPILATPFPSVIDCKALQFWKAELPMLVTLFGMVIEVSAVPQKALPLMEVKVEQSSTRDSRVQL